MTPFDPQALLAMLLAFYSVVGPAALVRARTERPEYFAGGVLIGHSGDALKLPDGRIFDLIFDVMGPSMHWQALDVSGPGGSAGEVDPYALEEGPLTPIDESAFVFVPPAPVFAPLVAGALGELNGTDDAAGRSAIEIAGTGAPADFDGDVTMALNEGAGALDEHLGSVAAFVPADELGKADGQGRATLAHGSDYDERTPAPLPPHEGGPIHTGPITREE